MLILITHDLNVFKLKFTQISKFCVTARVLGPRCRTPDTCYNNSECTIVFRGTENPIMDTYFDTVIQYNKFGNFLFFLRFDQLSECLEIPN